MKTPFRLSTLALSALLGTAAFAQPGPPYDVTVAGYVAGCTPNSYVHIITAQGTLPAIDIDVPLDANCGFAVDLPMVSFNGWFVVTTPCLGAIQSATGNYAINSFFPDSAVVWVTFDCVGSTTSDCMGVLGGSALPGTPCDFFGNGALDGIWDANCVCDTISTMIPDCLGIANGPNQPGTPCTNPSGAAGTWDMDCFCDTGNSGTTDCLGVLNGSNLPGTPCWVMGTNFIGTWDANCGCAPNSASTCQAGFWAMQAMGPDSLPVPNEIWVWNLSTTNVLPVTYLWSFGDGSSSTVAFPTHTYTGNGPYMLCLTIADASGCTSTSCDSISIDANGILSGMIIEGEVDGSEARTDGFTLNVQNPLTTAISEQAMFSNAAIWPNPSTGDLNLALVSLEDGLLNVSIFDVNGREVRNERRTMSAGRSQYHFDTNMLPAGLYTLRAMDRTGNSISLRFAKN